MTEPSPIRLPWIEPGNAFPSSARALTDQHGANGLVAASQSLTPEMLERAYRNGIFPWSGPGEPVLWWTPNPRMVLQLNDFQCRRSLRKTIRQAVERHYELRVDSCFQRVLTECAAPRQGQNGSWITPAIIQNYQKLQDRGLSHSLELFREDRLVGGLYLVSIGRMLFGESMVSLEPNTSKICLAMLVQWAKEHGGQYIDCQQQTQHLEFLGAQPLTRQLFESVLTKETEKPGFPWQETPPRLTLWME
ncbi:MAG: leucyl/phenylalanyl-tRNA--protein transferase [Proteobacteria bacterium]|nr:leucyl/phenylalanyl-tRNA--protein transferase [Pseudomonadota bacterium]